MLKVSSWFESPSPVIYPTPSPYPEIDFGTYAKVESESLCLGGNIGINFYIDFSDDVKNSSDAYVIINGQKQWLDMATKDGDMYIFSYNVCAKDYSKGIKLEAFGDESERVQFFVANAKYDYYETSVDEFYETSKEKGSPNMKSLAKAMQTYCGIANKYFQNNEYDYSLIDFNYEELSDYKKVIKGELPESLTYIGSSLILDSSTYVRHYFVGSSNGVNFNISNTKLNPQYVSENVFYIETNEINAVDLNKASVLNVSSGSLLWSVKYSPMSYCYDVYSKSSSQALKDLCQGLFEYYKAADMYFYGEEPLEDTVEWVESSKKIVYSYSVVDRSNIETPTIGGTSTPTPRVSPSPTIIAMPTISPIPTGVHVLSPTPTPTPEVMEEPTPIPTLEEVEDATPTPTPEVVEEPTPVVTVDPINNYYESDDGYTRKNAHFQTIWITPRVMAVKLNESEKKYLYFYTRMRLASEVEYPWEEEPYVTYDVTPTPTEEPTPTPTEEPTPTIFPSPMVYPSPSATVTPTPTTSVVDPREDHTSILKDKNGNTLYIKNFAGEYVIAKYADYYVISNTFYKRNDYGSYYYYTGWQVINYRTYFYTKEGYPVLGRQVIQGVVYYFDSNGALVTKSA